MFVALVLAFAPLIALLPVVKVVAPIALAWLGYRVDAYLAARTKTHQSTQASAGLAQFEAAIGRAVLTVQQTFIDDLIAKSADGTLTESEKRQALSKASDLAIAALPPAIEEFVRAYYGARLPAVIEGMIESAVRAQKPAALDALRAKVAKSELLEQVKERGLRNASKAAGDLLYKGLDAASKK